MQVLNIHPDNPQQRLLSQAETIIQQGGVIVYPTDCGYALGCLPGHKTSMDRIRRLRNLDHKHLFSLICSNISQASYYSRIDNTAFKLIKHHTPGAYTFILEATKQAPKQLLNPKRKTIGLHIPNDTLLLQLLNQLNSPLVSVSLLEHSDEHIGFTTEVLELLDAVAHDIDLVIDAGERCFAYSTVVDFTKSPHSIVRVGQGDTAPFEN